jgi:tRNA threonylcarbamoyladenosine modification (KEOPS) complex  Pcc1 subunit
MNKIKSFDEFVNENLVTKGVYNHYGPGSLRPLVMKLLSEGKNPQVVRTYLTSLGVEPWRIQKVFDEIEHSVAIENKVNEASKWKGKEIYPNWVTPKDIGSFVKNDKELKKGSLYVLLDLGMDVWQAEYEYIGKIGPMHQFKVTDQFAGDTEPIEYTDKELKDAIKDKEIALMESLNEGKKKMTFEEKANKFLSTLNEEEDEVNEAKSKKKMTFEDAANAFLLGLAGSDTIDEKLNKDTLQVEADGEDVDDMIDDLDDGDEDEYQGPDDEAPDSDDDDDDSDLEKAVATAKKDKKKLDRIKSILAEATAKGEVEIEGDGDEVELKVSADDEETGDEIEIEGPEEE